MGQSIGVDQADRFLELVDELTPTGDAAARDAGGVFSSQYIYGGLTAAAVILFLLGIYLLAKMVKAKKADVKQPTSSSTKSNNTVKKGTEVAKPEMAKPVAKQPTSASAKSSKKKKAKAKKIKALPKKVGGNGDGNKAFEPTSINTLGEVFAVQTKLGRKEAKYRKVPNPRPDSAIKADEHFLDGSSSNARTNGVRFAEHSTMRHMPSQGVENPWKWVHLPQLWLMQQ